MTLPELLAVLQKAPAVLAELTAIGTAVSATIGATGTAIEHIGETLGSDVLERFGQRLEAIGTDFPKLWRGSRFSKYVDNAAKRIGAK